MNYFGIAAVFAFIVLAQGCELNEELGQKIGMECAATHSDPAFLMAIAERMQNPNADAQPTFFCNYQRSLVNIIDCAKDKLAECIPEETKPLMDMFPSKERLAEGIKFMCDHKDILQDRCMDENVQSFAQCYMGKVNQLSSTLTSGSVPDTNQLKGLFCSVIRSEEQCFRDNRGSCSKNFVDMVIEMLEKFFPMSSCDAFGKKDLANSVLGSLLIHGQPQGSLKFKPAPYVIKN